MKVIALIAQKGGVGKTTLAQCLAVAAELDGKTVAIIDLDPQANAASWGDRRGQGSPAIVSAQPARLAQVLETARDNGVDLVIIDTPAKLEQSGLAAAKAADLVLIPSRPSIADLETIPATKDLLALAGDVQVFVIFNAVPVQGTRHEQAREVVQSQYGVPVASVMLHQRAAHGDAPVLGQTAQEYEPQGKAAQEIEHVYMFVREILNFTTGKAALLQKARA